MDKHRVVFWAHSCWLSLAAEEEEEEEADADVDTNAVTVAAAAVAAAALFLRIRCVLCDHQVQVGRGEGFRGFNTSEEEEREIALLKIPELLSANNSARFC